ncbi:MAG TPA: hypothetical protein VK886_17535 [Vicinamibacterales bacterium]|nr:hypothetical protein [Vicinamibacterales bacterium]
MVTDSRQQPDSAGETASADRLDLLPPRALPLVYFAAARLAFIAALLAVALEPGPMAASFYHARMLAAVHLVTLGWLTCSILASLYIVGPLALRIALPARAADYGCCALVLAGLAAACHGFWSNAPAQVGSGGALFLPAAALLAGRVVGALRRSPVQPAVVLHVALAFLNFFAAAALGIAIAFDKVHPFLPGARLANVFAHGHLAAVGWVGMMALGVGYRLFPMVLPAAMPEGRSLFASAVLLQAGVVSLSAGLVLQGTTATAAGALLVAAGFGAFFAHVRRMLRRLKPPPAARPSPDYGAWQSLASLAFLAAAVIAGLYLAFAPLSDATLRLAAAYGVLGLVGFFGQLVAGMEYRILPYFAWYWAFANTGFKGPAPNPHDMPLPGVQRAAFVLWAAGVPMLAAGMLFARAPLVAGGAWLLGVAVVLGGIDAAAIASHAFRAALPPKSRHRRWAGLPLD